MADLLRGGRSRAAAGDWLRQGERRGDGMSRPAPAAAPKRRAGSICTSAFGARVSGRPRARSGTASIQRRGTSTPASLRTVARSSSRARTAALRDRRPNPWTTRSSRAPWVARGMAWAIYSIPIEALEIPPW